MSGQNTTRWRVYTFSISDPAGRRLDGGAGLERCLLTGANPPGSASPPPVSVAKENLPVQVPSIRTFSSTSSVYQAAETSSEFPLPNKHLTDHIPRQYINPPSGQRLVLQVCQLFEALGLLINKKKSLLIPAQSLEFLGFQICFCMLCQRGNSAKSARMLIACYTR